MYTIVSIQEKKWTATVETLTLLCENNKGVYQHAHRRSLISAFVIRLLESIMAPLAWCKIQIFKLVSVAEQTGLTISFMNIHAKLHPLWIII